MWIKTIIYSVLTTLLFFGLIISFGWLDTGEQTNAQILRNVFLGQYLFFAIPVFIFSFFVYSGHKNDGRNFIFRLLLILVVSLAAYMGITAYLLTKLNGN
ncbi:MAG: hypothetical protein KW793_01240 [Candidatus Doudnabacteria bacterium]|nr:hypothetical protein [Candidatus Doudnabacteria bacterium]